MSQKSREEIELAQRKVLIRAIVTSAVSGALTNTTIDIEDALERCSIDHDRLAALKQGKADDVTLMELFELGLSFEMLLKIEFEPLK